MKVPNSPSSRSGKSSRPTGPREKSSPGVIRADEVYTLAEFKRRMGLRDAALRSARNGGFQVYYEHGYAFVEGINWIEYLRSTASRKRRNEQSS